MKNKRLLNVIGEIDERYIIEAVPAKRKNRRTVWMKFAATVACLCLVLTGIFGAVRHTVLGEPDPSTVEPSASAPAYNTEPEVKTGVTESDVPTEPVDNQSETDGVFYDDNLGVFEKGGFSMNAERIWYDYEDQLAMTDEIILGEVTEQLDGFYSGPDYEAEGFENMWISSFSVRVDKSYRGKHSKGDEILIVTRNYYKPGDEDPYVWIEDYNSLYLHEGQRALFMLDDSSDYLSIDGWDTTYTLVYDDEGLYEPKGTNEEGKEIYVSSNLELTLDNLPNDIKIADKQNSEDYKTKELPTEPDRIVVGCRGVETELMPGSEAFNLVFCSTINRIRYNITYNKNKRIDTLKLAAYDAETNEHLSVGLKKSETYVEFIYDEVSTQWYMAESKDGLCDKEIEVQRLFFPLSGQYHDCVFVGLDAEYKISAALGQIEDDGDLTDFVQGFFPKEDATEQNPNE